MPRLTPWEPVPVADQTKVADVAVNVMLELTLTSSVVALLPVNVNVPDPRLIVRVPVPLKENVPLNVMLGLLAEKSSVPVKLPAVNAVREIPFIVLSTVTVPPPDRASKVAVSAACLGTPPVPAQVPPVPPDEDDHDAVLLVLNVPVPPTQKHVAALATDTCRASANPKRIVERFFMSSISLNSSRR